LRWGAVHCLSRRRVLNGFTAHSQPVADPSPVQAFFADLFVFLCYDVIDELYGCLEGGVGLFMKLTKLAIVRERVSKWIY